MSARADRFRAGKRLWNAADDKLLIARYPHESTATLARQLRRSLTAVYGRARLLGLSKSAEYMASPDACRLRRGDDVGAPFRFKKGHVPANKGLRRPGWGPGRMKETQFKPGQRGSRWMPVGSTRVVDGYLYTKVRDLRSTKAGAGFVPWTRNWKVTHVLLWEKHHRRRVPRHHALAFRNGDRTDIRLDNLELITRRDLMARNTVHNLPKPLAETIQLLGALTRQIRRRTRGHEEQDRRPA
jgi:HNH endonuclease